LSRDFDLGGSLMLVRAALLPNPLIVSPETTVLEFCHNVLDSNQTSAAVIDETHELCGMISLTHVFRKILPHYVNMDSKLADVIHEGYFEERFDELQHTRVADLMERNTKTLRPDDSVMQAISLLSTAAYKTLPVVENGKFVGTVTRRSVLRQVTRSNP
jgi:CBS domain-containing protein